MIKTAVRTDLWIQLLTFTMDIAVWIPSEHAKEVSVSSSCDMKVSIAENKHIRIPLVPMSLTTGELKRIRQIARNETSALQLHAKRYEELSRRG